MTPNILPMTDQKKTYSKSEPLISIVVPFYNEEDNLEACHRELTKELDKLTGYCEVVYIDDGSSDNGWSMVCRFHCERHRIHRVRLSRNFGKEAALSAGLSIATGRAVIPFDADLQDPPEYIHDMVLAWQQGADIVEMKRRERLGESVAKRLSAKMFYKTLNFLSDIELSENVGDFRLLDRKVIKVINSLPEKNRYMKGLLTWPGFKRTILTFDRKPRHSGHSKWNYLALFHLAFEGITSFSIKPLRLATMAGLIVSFMAFAYAFYTFFDTLLYGNPVAGFPTLEITMLFLGGIQLLSIGLLGEYVGRLFIESKQRPLFVVMNEEVTLPVTQNTTYFKTSSPAKANNK